MGWSGPRGGRTAIVPSYGELTPILGDSQLGGYRRYFRAYHVMLDQSGFSGPSLFPWSWSRLISMHKPSKGPLYECFCVFFDALAMSDD
jgi:hypothetical protein